MHFRLVYDGALLAHRHGERLPERSLHVHDIRRKFHAQVKTLWKTHPILQNEEYKKIGVIGAKGIQDFDREGFVWRPIVSEAIGLLCALDILMLRDGRPGRAIHDINNRLKTIFDALRMPKGPDELGHGTSRGKQSRACGTCEGPRHLGCSATDWPQDVPFFRT
jgi:hypothetical protein